MFSLVSIVFQREILRPTCLLLLFFFTSSENDGTLGGGGFRGNINFKFFIDNEKKK